MGSKEAAEVQEAFVKICIGIKEKNLKVDELKSQLALRASTTQPTPQPPPQYDPVLAAQVFDASAFVGSKKAWLDNVRTMQERLSENGRDQLVVLGPTLDEIEALLCKAQATCSSELDWAAGIVSTNLPLEKPTGIEASPERTAAAAVEVTPPPIPNPVLVPDAPLTAPHDFANIAIPSGDGKELDDMDLDTSKTDTKRKYEVDEGPIPSFEQLMAMADVCIAESASQSKKEGGSTKKSKGSDNAGTTD